MSDISNQYSDEFHSPTYEGGMVNMASRSFLSQVLLYFGLAVLISAAGAYTGFRFFAPLFLENPIFIWIFFAVELVLAFTSRMWSTKRPINYILFAAFTFITGITIVPLLLSVIYEFGGPALIEKALLATTLTFGAAGAAAWFSPKSLSGLRGFLSISLIGMIVVSLIGIFVPWSNNFEMLFSGFGVILFAGYAAYDIQRLKSYPQDRALDAAINLYLDIFNLFVYILRLMTGIARND